MKREELEQLGEFVVEGIKADHKEHKGHHDFIEAMMKREEAKQARWDKIQTSVIGSIALLVLGGVGKLVLLGFDQWVASK